MATVDLRERLKRALVQARLVTERILSELERPEDWSFQVAPGTNHALWIAGHLAVADNAFIGKIDPTKKVTNERYASLFGKGSTLRPSAADYPAPDEIWAFLRDRRTVLLALLDTLPDSELAREVPPPPPFMYDVAAIFQMAAWHEAIHTGQLTMIHRVVGKSPLADRPVA